MIDSENSNVPILLDVPGEGKVVQGQVYAIDEKGIEILDLFEENHEIGAYRRVKVDIVLNNKFLRSHEDQVRKCLHRARKNTQGAILVLLSRRTGRAIIIVNVGSCILKTYKDGPEIGRATLFWAKLDEPE